jgi:hypothetical protein
MEVSLQQIRDPQFLPKTSTVEAVSPISARTECADIDGFIASLGYSVISATVDE